LGGANGLTDYDALRVLVRADMPGLARAKTLAHDLLTAPTGLIWGVSGGRGGSDSPWLPMSTNPWAVGAAVRRNDEREEPNGWIVT
jgi:hypothetical protein